MAARDPGRALHRALKSGFAGLSMVTVLILAQLFDPRESTGFCSAAYLRGYGSVLVYRRHAQWAQIWRMLPPTILGVVVGYYLIRYIPGRKFSPVIGGIVLTMTAAATVAALAARLFSKDPHTGASDGAWGCRGVTTMLATPPGQWMGSISGHRIAELEFARQPAPGSSHFEPDQIPL